MISSEAVQEHILYDKIYQYLWVKSETSSPPNILIPDTVIITRSMPIYWYYYDASSGEIKKKMRKNVTKERIKENWLSRVGKSEVVACLLHFIDNLDLEKDQKLRMSSQIQVIYFDVEKFTQFMNKDIILPFGILQKFVEPAGEHNSQIQAFWSKSITLFTKRQCKKPFNSKMNIYERYCTFEGPEYFSEATQVKDFQSQRISEQIETMIQHLDAISYGKLLIKQGTFYFKVDGDAKCWFLFCGNLKFEDEYKKGKLFQVPEEIYQQSQIKIPKTIDNLMSVYNGRPLNLDRDQVCIQCNKLEKSRNFTEVPYQFVIDMKQRDSVWPEEVMKDAMEVKSATGSGKAYVNCMQAPMTLQKIHRKLDNDLYCSLQSMPKFNQKKVQVCSNCYMDMAKKQESLAMQQVVHGLSHDMSAHVTPLTSVHKPSTASQPRRIASQMSKKQSLKQILTKTPQIRPIEQYIKARLSSIITPGKFSIEQPSTAECMPRKKNTSQEITQSTHFKMGKDVHVNSLMEKLSKCKLII